MNTPNPGAHDTLAHHAINLAAIAFPVGSIILHLPEILSVLLTLAGLVWYGVLFYDRFSGKRSD